MYKAVHAAETLFTLTFVTVNDYLWLLRAVSQELSIFRRKALYYLAAAVSDFFLPRQKMVSQGFSLVHPNGQLTVPGRSLYTRSSPAKVVYPSRWIRFPKS